MNPARPILEIGKTAMERKIMKGYLRYWTALVILLGVSIPAQAQRMAPEPPPFMQACFAQMATARQMFVFRAAGLTVEDVHTSITSSVKVLRYLATLGTETTRDITELEESYHAMAEDIFNLSKEDFDNPVFQRAWGKANMEACMKKLAPKNPTAPRKQDLRMIPEQSA